MALGAGLYHPGRVLRIRSAAYNSRRYGLGYDEIPSDRQRTVNPSRAVELLRAAQTYELGNPWPTVGPLSPIYFRGYAYLAAGQGREAAQEFQKIIDHRGIVQNSPVGALAYLGLARSRAASGDTPGARTAYQDFLALWKDADPDVPILKEAQAEYAKLK
jgi:eukaryotic-like serine/threonine-protein kinase